jgi:flavodoxin
MMYQVLYYSKGGNTRKLADVIAGEIGVKAGDVRSSSPDPAAKVIFLGSGVYAGKPGEDMMNFIETHDFSGRKVAIFSTSWRTGENAFNGVADALKKKGAIVQRGYHCKGRAGFFNLGHPNREDLDGARKFARDMVKAG